MQVSCPHCGRRHDWSRDNPWRPFCSERCKMVDLGEWFAGGRAIPGDDDADPPAADDDGPRH